MTNGQKWNISKSLCSRKSAGFTADHNQDFFLLTCGNGSMLDFNSPSLPPGSWCRRWCQTESQRNSGSSTSSDLQKKKNPVDRTNLHSHGATLDFLRRYSRVRWGICSVASYLCWHWNTMSRRRHGRQSVRCQLTGPTPAPGAHG